MKINKLIVAREGLIIISLFIILGVAYYFSQKTKAVRALFEFVASQGVDITGYEQPWNWNNIIIFLIAAYPAYWTIRFLVWAIKTLRNETYS